MQLCQNVVQHYQLPNELGILGIVLNINVFEMVMTHWIFIELDVTLILTRDNIGLQQLIG